VTSNPESVLVATQDRYAPLLTATEQALSLAIGSAITITATKAQIVNNQEGDREKVVIDELSWQCNKNGTNLDQDVSIVFS
jgi:phosphatidylglycerophosphatase A